MKFSSVASQGAICVLAALFLTGCGTDSPYNDYLQILRQGVANTFSNPGITRDEAAAIPYATIGYRIDGGRENLIILATDSNGDLLWTSQFHVVLLTHDGRIMRTVGLPHDVSAVMPALGNSLPAPGAALKGAFTSARTEDFPNIGRYSVPVACKMVAIGRETISILGHAMATIRADESCQSTAVKWSFKDSYWLDPDSGFVWRSMQHLTPDGETIETEILRPPG